VSNTRTDLFDRLAAKWLFADMFLEQATRLIFAFGSRMSYDSFILKEPKELNLVEDVRERDFEVISGKESKFISVCQRKVLGVSKYQCC